MKAYSVVLLLGWAQMIMAQQIFSGVFLQTEAQMVYADQLKEDALKGKVADWTEAGYRIIDIESKLINSTRYYWLIGTKSDLKSQLKKSTGWDDFVKLKIAMARAGFVISDVEAFAINDYDHRYISVWHQGNTKHTVWKFNSIEGIKKKTEEMEKINFYPANLEVYQTPAKTPAYLISYYRGPSTSKTYISLNTDVRAFNVDRLQRSKSGYSLIDYQHYEFGDEDHFLCLFGRGDNASKFVRDPDLNKFNDLWKMQESEGLHLVKVHIQ